MLEAFLERLPHLSQETSLEIPAEFKDPNSVDLLIDQLKGMPNLTDLILVQGEFGRLELDRFEELTQIRSFRWVGSGERKRIPKGIFKMINLHLLEFRQSDFSLLPNEIESLIKLRYFKFQGNRNGRNILEISESIGKLSALRIFEISDIYVDRLPATIGACKNLEKLGVYNGERLYSLPDSIGNLSNLKVLELVNNTVRLLPETIGKLTDLVALDLTDNAISELPVSFSKLKSLEKLSLGGCRHLEYLPKNFEELNRLKSLKLKNERLDYSKALIRVATLSNLEVLEVLRYDEQPFEMPAMFGTAPALKWLRLNIGMMNSIQVLSVLTNIPTLEFLDLRAFDLMRLPPGFVELKQLKSVRLDIRMMHDKEIAYLFSTLSELPSLRHVSLCRGAKFVPREIILLQQLQSLDISNNPIHLLPPELGKLSRLQLLNLQGCKIQGSEVERIRLELPALQIQDQ